MRKNFFRLMTVLLLVFAFVLALGSCMPEKKDDGKGNETEPPVTNNVVTLDPNAALPFADYKIVRADKTTAGVKAAATLLRDKVKELTGTTPKLGTDFDGAVDKEILVGNTKRLSDNTLLLGNFKIVREGNKIAILGGSDDAIMEGVNYFIANCISDKGYLCGEGYSYFGGATYSITKLEVAGKEFAEVYVKSDIDNQNYGKSLATTFADSIGLPSDVTKDAKKANVVITNDKSFNVKDGEWALTVKNGILYIVVSDEYSQKAAYDGVVSMLKNTKGALTFKDGENKREKLETKEEFYKKEQLVIYKEFPAQINRNYDYKVSVTQGDQTHSIPVYNHTMEYDDSGRGVGGNYYRRFSQFAFSGKQVRVDIKVGFDFSTYSVFPSAKQFESDFKDGVISVYLDEPDYFGIRLDDDDNTILSVFADLPEYPLDIPVKGDENVTYVEGWMDVENGLLNIDKPNSVLYIAPGAVVNARVNISSKASYSKVLGRGAILDAFSDIYKYDIREGGTEGTGWKLCMLNGEGTIFDGPILMDARCFNLTTGSTGVTVRNYKAMSSMMTTDGITAMGSDTTYEHCWIYCGDNGLVISWTKDQKYKDITIGTTCAAVFPQGNTNNIEIEDLYVFRANDGVVNNWYNSPYTKEVTSSVTMRNVDCVDLIACSRFFGGRNMGTIDDKTFKFININIGEITGTTSQHTSKEKKNVNRIVHMENPVEMFTENYTLNFTNLYVDGEAITNASQVLVVNNWRNIITFDNDGTYKPVKKDIHRVNWSAPGKVFLGDYRVSFASDVIKEGNELLVPADEFIKAARAKKSDAPTVEKNGIQYIKSSNLAKVDTVASARITNGSLYVTLKAPKGNLFLPDESQVSQIAEQTAWTVDMVTEDNDGDYIYTCHAHDEDVNGGLSIKITEEIKMYGAGTYTFAFQMRGSNNGGIKYGWTMDDFDSTKTSYTTTNVESMWDDYEITINVTPSMIQNAELFTVKIAGSAAGQMDYFSVRYLELYKD